MSGGSPAGTVAPGGGSAPGDPDPGLVAELDGGSGQLPSSGPPIAGCPMSGVYRVSGGAFSAESNTMRPWFSSIVRKSFLRTISRSWVAITTDVPAGVDIAKELEDARVARSSRFPVGSSARMK